MHPVILGPIDDSCLSLFAVSERTHKVLFYPLGFDPLLLLFLYLKYPGLDLQAGFPVLLICPCLFFSFFFFLLDATRWSRLVLYCCGQSQNQPFLQITWFLFTESGFLSTGFLPFWKLVLSWLFRRGVTFSSYHTLLSRMCSTMCLSADFPLPARPQCLWECVSPETKASGYEQSLSSTHAYIFVWKLFHRQFGAK